MPKGKHGSRTIPTCHPDRRHKGKGLCERCYDVQWRRKVRNDPKRKLQMQAWDLKKYYGITPEQYEALLIKQGRMCAICGKPPGRYRLAVDHDHATGRIRGLLCGKCNVGVVGFEDLEFVRRALEYIKCPE